jgi:hypothetical protein
MNTAAHQAASYAACARRNAKVVGDVARRYCGNGDDKGNVKSSSSGGGIKNSMKTREVHEVNNYNSHDNNDNDEVHADELLHNDINVVSAMLIQIITFVPPAPTPSPPITVALLLLPTFSHPLLPLLLLLSPTPTVLSFRCNLFALLLHPS